MTSGGGWTGRVGKMDRCRAQRAGCSNSPQRSDGKLSPQRSDGKLETRRRLDLLGIRDNHSPGEYGA
jgi:hypothetical protein